MTAASSAGTPLAVLSLVVAILAVLVARANVQRQIQVTAREAWMREFREHVTQFLAVSAENHHLLRNAGSLGGGVDEAKWILEVTRSQRSALNAVSLLLVERGGERRDDTFDEINRLFSEFPRHPSQLQRLVRGETQPADAQLDTRPDTQLLQRMDSMISPENDAADEAFFTVQSQAVHTLAGIILRLERNAIEARKWRSRLRSWRGAVGWSRLKAWLERGPPRFPDLP